VLKPQLERYHRSVWSIDKLLDNKYYYLERELKECKRNGLENVIVINVTGKGAEAVARAWCAQQGANAVIRHPKGPCFACAFRAASKDGLGTGILICTEVNSSLGHTSLYQL
jgi:hypothetical protein